MDAPLRARISRGEIITGAALLAFVASHYGWCAWSLPRYGVVTAHGLETRTCNWGSVLLAAFIGGLALLTLTTGVVSFWCRSRAAAWWAAQSPAIAVWLWWIWEFVDALRPRSV